MKPSHTTIASIGIALCLQPTAFAQQFSSGSTGADGPLNVTQNTVLDLPPDGIFHFTTIAIGSGATLTFRKNAHNTPVYLLASGDVTITGQIAVNAQGQLGGPGGFDGGYAPFQGFPAGAGQGPGGGVPGSQATSKYGVYAVATGNNNNTYGNTLISPLIGGSGSGAATDFDRPGGGGGGAILIASSSRIQLNGISSGVYGNGSRINNEYGSGGAVRLVAPVVSGNGIIEATSLSGTQAHGRVRIDCIDRFAHRSIRLSGIGTRGSQMFVFPPNNPKLDILNAAGTSIPEGTTGPVTVTLPVGSSTEQTVRVQARGFTGDIPIRVKITPENGTAATFDAVIPAASGNPPFVDVPVTLVVDTVCHVHAWTR